MKRQTMVNQMLSWEGRNKADGSHKVIIDIYNDNLKPLPRGYKVKYTDAWCATTMSACAIACGWTDKDFPMECGCEEMIEKFKKRGQWVEDDAFIPPIGAIVFYDWDDTGKGDCKGHADHVGMVIKVDGKNITVMEGNKSNAVGRRVIQVNGRYIRGYGLPKYDDKEVSVPKDTNTSFKSYTVGVTADALNVRDGAGTEYKVNKVIKKLVIVEEKNGFGRLEDGSGWISLKNTKKIE